MSHVLDLVAALAVIVALVGVAIVLALLRWQRRQRRAAALRWPAAPTHSHLPRAGWFAWLLLLAACLAALSALGWEREDRPATGAPEGGATTVFVLDISRSMEVEDILPTRRDAASSLLAHVIDRLEHLRAGLVVFAGESLLVCPVTTDAGALRMALEEIPDGLGFVVGGSSLSEGLDRALDALGNDQSDSVLLLLTDGEQTAGELEATIARAAARNVRIHTIGIATTQGGRMSVERPAPDSAGVPNEWRVSRLDADRLRHIADATDGRYIAWAGDETLREVEQLLMSARSPTGTRRPAAQSQTNRAFLLGAFLCLSLELGLATLSRS